ncbi:MAG: RNA methyltransferase [Myxococcales bacterium]|nr:RNA methyltransferase [Myxococcales bacterium]MDD9966999.1 RNA methyltransferase [Myxococcales bacterium]
MLKYDPNDVVAPSGPPALSVPAATVIDALSPLLTPARLARIDAVVAQRTRSVVPVLDGLIDPHNVAAVLRSADAFGIQDVHVIQGTEAFVASHRVAQGTEQWLDLVRHADAQACARHLRASGYRLLVAQMEAEVTPAQLPDLGKVAVVFGNEHAGVSPQLTEIADGRYGIPMRGFVESLNVSVASAITLQHATQHRAGDLSLLEQQELRARFMMLSVDRADEIIAEYLRRRS